MTNEYPNIFALEKIDKYLDEWIYSSKYIRMYLNIQIFVPHCTDTTYICEGVETGLSVLQAFPSEHVLVSLGKANMAKMDPDMMTEKVVFVLDNDGLDYCQDRLIGRSSLERICTEVFRQIST